jgi:hypothetical protein
MLRTTASVRVNDLPDRVGASADRVEDALDGLERDGLVTIARGRARLAS